MVETTEVPRKKHIQAWYLCALLHYQGKHNNAELWTVALLRKGITIKGITTKWEFIENLDYDTALAFIDEVKPRLVKCTPGDLKKSMPDE